MGAGEDLLTLVKSGNQTALTEMKEVKLNGGDPDCAEKHREMMKPVIKGFARVFELDEMSFERQERIFKLLEDKAEVVKKPVASVNGILAALGVGGGVGGGGILGWFLFMVFKDKGWL